MKKIFAIITLCLATAYVSAANDSIPKLTSESNVRPTWSNTDKFTAVPPSLQKVGVETCQKFGFNDVKGYVAEAYASNGTPFTKGAFLCVGQKTN